MECPNCRVELQIKRSYVNTIDGAVYTVLEKHCVNPVCPLRSNIIPANVEFVEHPSMEPNYVFIDCSECGVPLLKLEDGAYISIAECKEKDGAVEIVCPNCEKQNEIFLTTG